MLSCDISQEQVKPEVITIKSNSKIELSTFSSVIHYGQSIFEGLKAYRCEDGKIAVFRLEDHARRFQKSAEIMGMPSFDPEVFIESVKEFVKYCEPFVPDRPDTSLYLRPLLIANDPVIKVRASEDYKFLVMGAIVGSYFSGGKEGAKVYCNQEFVRAFPHGTGEAKTAANYALSLPGMRYIQKQGYEQILYLDSQTKTNVDELGGMNFFMFKEGKLLTPALKGTILHGVTRNCVLTIAKHLGIETEERDVKLEEILGEHEGIFACGTAATLVPIIQLGFEAKKGEGIKAHDFPIHPKIKEIRDYLYQAQRNGNEHSKQWLTFV